MTIELDPEVDHRAVQTQFKSGAPTGLVAHQADNRHVQAVSPEDRARYQALDRPSPEAEESSKVP
jgi:hypothetical protein